MKMPKPVKRHLALSLSLVVLTTALAGVVSHFVLSKAYTSTATLIVMPGNNANGLISALQLTPTFADLATSNLVWDKASRALPVVLSPATLQSRTHVDAITNTDLITITTTAPSASLAAAEATQIAMATMTAARQLTGSSPLELSSPAAPPLAPSFPDMKKIELMAFSLSVMGSVFLAALREHFNTHLESEDDVTKWLKIPVLAAIPHVAPRLVRNNPLVFSDNRVDKEEAKNALNTVRIHAQRRESP